MEENKIIGVDIDTLESFNGDYNFINYNWIDFKYVISQLNKDECSFLSEIGLTTQLFEKVGQSRRIELCEQILKAVRNSNQLKLNRWFDIASYLEARPDVKMADINATYHYFSCGYKENPEFGRVCRPSLRLEALRIKHNIRKKVFDPTEIAISWQNNIIQEPVLAVNQVIRRLAGHCRDSTMTLFSISHDNPYVNTGGIQKIIREETRVCGLKNITYIHLSPGSPLPFVSNIMKKDKPSFLNVSINGSFYCSVLESSLGLLLEECKSFSRVVIHHLFGFDTINLANAVKCYAERGNAYMWVHDYSVSCINYKLLRNDHLFCGSPDPGNNEQECVFCEYSLSRKMALTAISSITKLKNLQFVFPSNAAREVTEKFFSLVPIHAKKHVLSHISIESHESGEKIIELGLRKIRIAFCGFPLRHKGWDEFAILSTDPLLSTRYEWYHIGKDKSDLSIDFWKVDGIEGNSICDLLEQLEIDYVFVWPLWPETFCLVAYEALLAGCHILTNRCSGNVVRGLPSDAVTCIDSLDDVYDFLLDQARSDQPVKVSYCKNICVKDSMYSLSLFDYDSN